MMTFRHLLAVLLLPFTVVVLVPTWLLTSWAEADTRWTYLWGLGAALFALGLALFAWCVGLFGRVGQGTLAPWDPTQKLVAVGPYKYVRNPMITGVAAMLLGEALFSWLIGLWLLVFALINHTYFVLSEEPGLERRFGESYRVYKANVPRWVPRLRPWQGSGD
jgi:protein-S-isoprenylcysteine O-methyltransferase Ste14